MATPLFVYNRANVEDNSGLHYNPSDYAWAPETADLTDFYGIGEAAAEELDGEFVMIDQMVVDGKLREGVLEAVSAQFVDGLVEELQERLDEVREKRDGDLELLEKAEADDGPWWEWREKFDGIGGLEHDAMVLKDADEGDELEVQTMDFETYVGRVVPVESSEKYVKVELEGTGIDADRVEVVSQRGDVWSRPLLRTTEIEEKEDRTVNRVDSTDLYGVFWP